MHRTRLHAALPALMVLAIPGLALAQEFCVACTEPAAVYRCVIEGAQPHGTQSLQMLCITTMAKQGAHATCSMKRGTVFDCDGPVKRVPWAALNSPQQAPAPTAAAPPQDSPATPAPPADKPPATMLDLAKRANEQSAKDMKEAAGKMKEGAKSVGDATKKTWDCVISFFTRCGGDK